MPRAIGLLLAGAYAGLIIWLYAAQPQTIAEVTGGLTAQVGAYRVDEVALAEGLRFFRQDQFPEARAALARADPASRDAVTQFYVAYACYRQGWGRFYSDDALFRQGLEAVERAIGLRPDHRLVVDDPNLTLRSADELRAELQRGLTREASDFNPLRAFRPRK